MTETQNSQRSPLIQVPFSLRSKILAGILLIVLFTVSAMGYFVFSRSQAANKFLTDQFDVSVSREIENRLTLITTEEVDSIDNFFLSMKNVIEIFGASTGSIISSDKITAPGDNTWNALLNLTQLPGGGWDNPNNQPASIFIPSTQNFTDDIAQELVSLKDLDYFTHSLLEHNPNIIAIYFGGNSGETVYYPNIDLAAIVPPDFDVTHRTWYLNAVESGNKAVWSAPYQDAARNGLVITSSTSVFDSSEKFRGVAGADIKISSITDRISTLSIGKTGYGFLIDSEGRVIAIPRKGYQDFKLSEEEIQSGDIDNLSLINRVPLEVNEVLAKMTSGQSGIQLVNFNGVNRYISYKPIPTIGYSLGIVVNEDELLQEFVETNKTIENETRRTILNSVGVIAFLLAVAGLASFGIGNSITAPLSKLTKVAEDVAGGNLNARSEVDTNDEIGILGHTLNSMTSTAQELIANLEDKVAQRTKVIERKVAQIQAVAEVGKAVAAQRDLEELLIRTTHLISNRFGFYHVGIFLLDQRGEFAVLRAANSRGGQQMIARIHKLRVGIDGVVGTVAGTGEARIVFDADEDTTYFDNPDLPHTRSEMALPLSAGGSVLGVLDIQSTEANAFSDEDISTLQILADQLATAVQNARLITDTREALISARRATGDVSHRGWQSLLQETDIPGYIGMANGEIAKITANLDESTRSEIEKGELLFSTDQRTISVPITTRGQTVGMMRLVKPSHAKPWTMDEISDVEKLSIQISAALESARLYDDARRHALREQKISELTSKISSSTTIDSILRSTVEELGRKISGTEIVFELDTSTQDLLK